MYGKLLYIHIYPLVIFIDFFFNMFQYCIMDQFERIGNISTRQFWVIIKNDFRKCHIEKAILGRG